MEYRMKLESGKYYHIYNRSNNRELVFKEPENYRFFFEKYTTMISPHVETVAYCLMPTHFHCCIKVNTDDPLLLKRKIGILLSSYTRAINSRFNRHGGLFQHHTKAIEIHDESYLLTLSLYIHQDPIRARLVKDQLDWIFSSYRSFSGGNSSIPVSHEVVRRILGNNTDYISYSQTILRSVKQQYWIQ